MELSKKLKKAFKIPQVKNFSRMLKYNNAVKLPFGELAVLDENGLIWVSERGSYYRVPKVWECEMWLEHSIVK